jgi:hypothetical protein
MFESIDAPKGPNWRLRFVFASIILALVLGLGWISRMTRMPLRSYRGTLPPVSPQQLELANRLTADVNYLSATIGERSLSGAGSLNQTVEYLSGRLREAGYAVTERRYSVDGQEVSNLEASLLGRDGKSGLVVLGAHYDSVP